jgi:hypothetical protein
MAESKKLIGTPSRDPPVTALESKTMRVAGRSISPYRRYEEEINDGP